MTRKNDTVKVVDCEWIKAEIKGAEETIKEEGYAIIAIPRSRISPALTQQVQQAFPDLRISLHSAPNPGGNCWLEVDAAFINPK